MGDEEGWMPPSNRTMTLFAVLNGGLPPMVLLTAELLVAIPFTIAALARGRAARTFVHRAWLSMVVAAACLAVPKARRGTASRRER